MSRAYVLVRGSLMFLFLKKMRAIIAKTHESAERSFIDIGEEAVRYELKDLRSECEVLEKKYGYRFLIDTLRVDINIDETPVTLASLKNTLRVPEPVSCQDVRITIPKGNPFFERLLKAYNNAQLAGTEAAKAIQEIDSFKYEHEYAWEIFLKYPCLMHFIDERFRSMIERDLAKVARRKKTPIFKAPNMDFVALMMRLALSK